MKSGSGMLLNKTRIFFIYFFQGKNSFVVPFPYRDDLQRSVTFDNSDIKEHGVNLLFEEWKHVERKDNHYKECGLQFLGCYKN
jgi:hypothetical protein